MANRDPKTDPRSGDMLRVTLRITRMENRVVHYVVEGTSPIRAELSMPLDMWRRLTTQGQVDVIHAEPGRV